MRKRTDFLFLLSEENSLNIIRDVCGDDFSFQATTDQKEALKLLEQEDFSVVWIEVLPDSNRSLQFLEWLRTQSYLSKTGILFSKGYSESFLKALALGAQFFLNQSLLEDPERLKVDLKKVLASCENDWARTFPLHAEEAWIASSDSSRSLRTEAYERIADPTQALVLYGPEGCGKVRLGRGALESLKLHHIVVWDTEATPDYEQKKQFLDATQVFAQNEHVGWIISEVGDLDLDLQELLAEWLRNEGWKRDGEILRPQVHLVITTSESLSELLEQKRLREDLYHLLDRRPLKIPPLNERPQDVISLAHFFLENREGDARRVFSEDAIQVLLSHDWPGEVAELKSVVASLQLRETDGFVTVTDLPSFLLEKSFYLPIDSDEEIWQMPYQDAKKRALHKFNNTYMKRLLADSGDNITVAAEKAGMDRSNFKKLLKKV